MKQLRKRRIIIIQREEVLETLQFGLYERAKQASAANGNRIAAVFPSVADTAEHLDVVIEQVKRELEIIKLDIVKVFSEYRADEEFYVMLNLKIFEKEWQAVAPHPPDRMEFFKLLVQQMVYDGRGTSTLRVAYNVGEHMAPKLTDTTVRALLEKMKRDKWLMNVERNDDEEEAHVGLHPRAVADLKNYLRQFDLNPCPICDQMVIGKQRQQCPTCSQCSHMHCMAKVYRRTAVQQVLCRAVNERGSRCSAVWPYDPILLEQMEE